MDSYLPTSFAEIFESATKTMLTEARVKAVIAAYDKALAADEKLPTYLHAAIEGLRRNS